MASGASKSAALGLLMVNLVLYIIIIIIAAWAVNHGIGRSKETASILSIPARIFPVYFPMGNMATGFFVTLSLLAGIVGFTTSFLGINHIFQGSTASLQAAAASAVTAWLLTLLAMGLACKEIQLGWTDTKLRMLEIMTIIVSGTQLLCMGAIHAGLEDLVVHKRVTGGRV